MVKGSKAAQLAKTTEVGGHALKANLTNLGPLVLPVSEQNSISLPLCSSRTSLTSLTFLTISSHLSTFAYWQQARKSRSLLFKNKSNKPYILDYKLTFEHICILATSKKVLDEIQKNLELTDEYMEASRKTLDRFGNTSSSSVWYELAYLEANSRIKRGDRIWPIGFGLGFKCNSAVWKALKNVNGKPRNW